MKRLTLGTLSGAALLLAAGSAHAQGPWSDNFDSYTQNIFLAGNGGWEEWNLSTAASQTKVKDVPSGAAVRSAPHSIWVRGSSDTIYDWDKADAGLYTSGQWTFCGWIYKPTTTTGFVMDIPTFWIMLNKYKHNSTNFNNWSVQVTFSPITGNYNATGATTTYTGPCVFDQWVETRAEIDLGTDTVELFYNGSSIAQYQWNGGTSGFGTGDTRIDTLDLYADGGLSPSSRVYWDDLSLSPGFNGCGSVACQSNPTNYCTAGISADGCQATLSASGTASAGGAGTFTLSASNVAGDKDGLFFAGTNGPQANQWGNGTSFQCVVPPVKRYGLLGKTGTAGQCDGAFSQELNAYWQANLNKNPGAGATVHMQLWYRDPANTSNQTTSLSDGITFTVCP
jgi:hypothetical protein